MNWAFATMWWLLWLFEAQWLHLSPEGQSSLQSLPQTTAVPRLWVDAAKTETYFRSGLPRPRDCLGIQGLGRPGQAWPVGTEKGKGSAEQRAAHIHPEPIYITVEMTFGCGSGSEERFLCVKLRATSQEADCICGCAS